MIKFFRNIRRSLLNEGKTSKYLKYAVGEIVLVVIGILIALQINNWNKIKQDHKKERQFLSEIVTNLKADSLKLEEDLVFNKNKTATTEELLKIFVDTLSNEERFDIVLKNMGKFSQHTYFSPEKVTFDNLIASENLNLISDKAIRNKLIKYYEFNYERYQERVWVNNRNVIDNYFYPFVVKEKVGFPNDFPSIKDLNIHTDQKFFTDLYNVIEIVRYQDAFFKETQGKNQKLLSNINSFLK